MRAGDLAGRIGGDEFALWMAGVDAAAAPGRAEAILAAGRELSAYSGGPEHPLGLSIGMAILAPGSAESCEELMARADAAMYEAKRGGKGWYRLAATPSAASIMPAPRRTL